MSGAAPPERGDWADAHARAVSDQRARADAAFDALRVRAALPASALRRTPADGGWSGLAVLEHVLLVHGYVFLLIEKIAERSRARLARGAPWPTAPPALEVVARLADPGRRWPHPEHMTPRGAAREEDVARRLEEDRRRVAAWLDAMPRGEGTLHRVRMSRVDARLDLYQWIELVVRHAERHALQIDRAVAERGEPPAAERQAGR